MAGTERAELEPVKTSTRRQGLARGLPGLRFYLVPLTGLLMLANLYLIFMVAPTDADTGHVQRVMYLHVPLATMSFLAFLMVFVASILHLARREARWDSLAHASAEVGVVFISLALITGMIWAKPIWNAWWLWTPRLTTTLILWLIYAAYLMVRAYAPSREKGALYGAVMGIVGFADVIIVYFSVQWWPGIHPEPVIGPQSAGDALDPTMRAVLLFSFAAFFFLLLFLVLERMELQKIEDRVRDVRLKLRRGRG